MEKKPTSANCLEFEVPFSQTEYEHALICRHFPEADLLKCLKIWEKIGSTCRVKSWYGIAQEDGIVVVMTLGKQFDKLMEQYETEGELLKAYALECFAMEILRKAYGLFENVLYSHIGKYPGEFRFLDEEQMKKVPEILSQLDIDEVQCNEAFALIPQKTVVFFTQLSKEKKTDCTRICKNCGQRNCSSRIQEKKREEKTVLNYGYQRILGNRGNELWKKG